jgi:hypothetical protein
MRSLTRFINLAIEGILPLLYGGSPSLQLLGCHRRLEFGKARKVDAFTG